MLPAAGSGRVTGAPQLGPHRMLKLWADLTVPGCMEVPRDQAHVHACHMSPQGQREASGRWRLGELLRGGINRGQQCLPPALGRVILCAPPSLNSSCRCLLVLPTAGWWAGLKPWLWNEGVLQTALTASFALTMALKCIMMLRSESSAHCRGTCVACCAGGKKQLLLCPSASIAPWAPCTAPPAARLLPGRPRRAASKIERTNEAHCLG